MHFIVTKDDEACTLEEAECIFDTINTFMDEDLIDDRALHTWRKINGDHDLFMDEESSVEDFVTELIGTIEDKAKELAALTSVISLLTYFLL